MEKQIREKIFSDRSEIKPWLQAFLSPSGINIVIERSDDTKIVFKCKRIKSNCSVCPFRVRANYSSRAKKWTLVVVNSQHNHPLIQSVRLPEFKTFSTGLENVPRNIPALSSPKEISPPGWLEGGTFHRVNSLHLELNRLLLQFSASEILSDKEEVYMDLIGILKKNLESSPPNYVTNGVTGGSANLQLPHRFLPSPMSCGLTTEEFTSDQVKNEEQEEKSNSYGVIPNHR